MPLPIHAGIASNRLRKGHDQEIDVPYLAGPAFGCGTEKNSPFNEDFLKMGTPRLCKALWMTAARFPRPFFSSRHRRANLCMKSVPFAGPSLSY